MAFRSSWLGRLTVLALSSAVASCATTERVAATWEVTPSVERAGDVYPAFATQIDMGGRVEVSCTTDAAGALTDCTIAEAEPAGLGFEQAALAVARTGRVNPATLNGVPEAGSVRFVIPFSLGSRPEAPAPWAEDDPSQEAMALARQVVARWPMPQRPDPAGLDVAPDRADWVADLILSVEREMDEERRAAWALSLARLYSEGQLRMLTVGQRRPSQPPRTARTESARDRLFAYDDARALRLRRAYCERYGCGAFESVF